MWFVSTSNTIRGTVLWAQGKPWLCYIIQMRSLRFDLSVSKCPQVPPEGSSRSSPINSVYYHELIMNTQIPLESHKYTGFITFYLSFVCDCGICYFTSIKELCMEHYRCYLFVLKAVLHKVVQKVVQIHYDKLLFINSGNLCIHHNVNYRIYQLYPWISNFYSYFHIYKSRSSHSFHIPINLKYFQSNLVNFNDFEILLLKFS